MLKVKWMLLSAVLAASLVQSEPVTLYVNAVKSDQALPILADQDERERLREQIKKEAPNHYLPPIDARVDRIWKAIPGLNGREVDIEATLDKTIKQKNKDTIQWVYKEIPPKITLDQLGAVPIYRGNDKKQAAAIMVNVAWGTEYLPAMLEIFEKEKVKATFFLDGSWLKKHPKEAKKIVASGHEIGNHAYSHPLLSTVSSDRIEQEIGKTSQLINQTLNIKSQWFAPPAGDFDQRVVDIAFKNQMKTVLWTVDTVDWRKDSTPARMVERIEKGIGPGSLILMHPTDRTVTALPQIVRLVKRKGIKLGTVGEVLSSKRMEKIE
ncbi:polysaccharide deacetylase family protein [Thermoflavimicrobium dichotomicum]|uniref:Probable sporulation protein, polysaccharide deacetylase family n=1 Tax=Thermoflavimicrobium dichotomicum TaxID=46223 RepID=A0A1I3PQC9_9BACL|nr:polysaccharide deacetylase family protein [Thermoflavimicrobium dichotomicum]SFJ23540.1 probable sporulation protein, polysaccharide deacetylase family [Thermoflavimicrobium dichotomicum]